MGQILRTIVILALYTPLLGKCKRSDAVQQRTTKSSTVARHAIDSRVRAHAKILASGSSRICARKLWSTAPIFYGCVDRGPDALGSPLRISVRYQPETEESQRNRERQSTTRDEASRQPFPKSPLVTITTWEPFPSVARFTSSTTLADVFHS